MWEVLREVENVREFVTCRPSTRRQHVGIEREAEVKPSGVQNPLRDLRPWIDSLGLVGEERRM
jgi:hypothetical protein